MLLVFEDDDGKIHGSGPVTVLCHAVPRWRGADRTSGAPSWDVRSETTRGGAVNEDEGLWALRELAQFLSYSETTIYRMVSQCPEKL